MSTASVDLPVRRWSRADLRARGPIIGATALAAIWGIVANLTRLGFPGRGYDEPFYAIAGWRYVHGDATRTPSWRGSGVDNYAHPPLAKYLFGLAELVAGHPSVVADRVVAGLCTLATAVVLGLWLARIAGRWVGLGAATLVAVLPMSVPVTGVAFRFGRYGYLDPVAELFAVASLALAWSWFAQDGKRAWQLATATGVCIGLATAAKENGFLGALGPVALGLALSLRRRRGPALRLLQAIAAAVIAVLVFVLSYLPIANPGAAIGALWRFQRFHADLGHRVTFAGRSTDHPPGWAFLWFAQHGMGPVAATICGAAAVVAIAVRRDQLVAWCSMALVGPLVFHMAIAGVILPFYWVMWMPAFLALVALGVAELGAVARSSRRAGQRRRGRTPRVVLLAGSVAVLAVASLVDTGRMLGRADPPDTSYAHAVLARTPSVYLRLGERFASTAKDSSGNRRPGSYVGRVALGRPGLLVGDSDRAASFTDRTARVTITAGAWMNVADFTVTVWFTGGGAGRYLVARDNFLHKAWDLSTDDTGHLRCVTFASFGGAGQVVTSKRDLDDGRPHQAACVKQGGSVSLYVDGALQASQSWPTFSSATSQGIDLAQRGNGAGHFGGTLDEFAFFGAALSAAEVATLYRDGTTRPAQPN